MTDPWFRRYAGFSYKPTTWQGWTVIAIMAAVFIACGALWMSLVDTQPTLAWIIATIGFLAAVAGHAVVLWKMDRDYTSR
jgi:hypothetical protein